ncbi:hypothetical protein RCH10_002516 [Variovorax sp. GrIS 2.14]|uniref:hypothetical protein n=1 Tax=Variovorax sp. GrIS 2.14 TaxID=3071709 RepID=UPI0038F60248
MFIARSVSLVITVSSATEAPTTARQTRPADHVVGGQTKQTLAGMERVNDRATEQIGRRGQLSPPTARAAHWAQAMSNRHTGNTNTETDIENC